MCSALPSSPSHSLLNHTSHALCLPKDTSDQKQEPLGPPSLGGGVGGGHTGKAVTEGHRKFLLTGRSAKSGLSELGQDPSWSGIHLKDNQEEETEKGIGFQMHGGWAVAPGLHNLGPSTVTVVSSPFLSCPS